MIEIFLPTETLKERYTKAFNLTHWDEAEKYAEELNRRGIYWGSDGWWKGRPAGTPVTWYLLLAAVGYVLMVIWMTVTG